MMDVRRARPSDAAGLARLHVAAWEETYPGLLPPEEIARRGYADRLTTWTAALNGGPTRIAIAPGAGFAQIGPQREAAIAEAGAEEELWSMYLPRAAQGTGLARALLTHALGPDARPFSACVLAANTRACAFYERTGARLLPTRDERIGQTPIRERVYLWRDPTRVRRI